MQDCFIAGDRLTLYSEGAEISKPMILFLFLALPRVQSVRMDEFLRPS